MGTMMVQGDVRLGDDGDQRRRDTVINDLDATKEFSATDANNNNYCNVDDFISQSWLPMSSTTWDSACLSSGSWTQDIPAPVTLPFGYQGVLYTDLSDHSSPSNSSYSNNEHASSSNAEINEYQPSGQSINQNTQTYGRNFHSQTPHTSTQLNPYEVASSIPILDASDCSHLYAYNNSDFRQVLGPTWIRETGKSTRDAVVGNHNHDEPKSMTESPFGVLPEWNICEQIWDSSPKPKTTPIAENISKRKDVGLAPPQQKKSKSSSQEGLADFVNVFENAPGALATVKRRRKLDAPVKKAARDVRRAGACHQCRFRKRTCSTGTPCGSCLKNGRGLHELKCQRESPFVGNQPMHEYFEHSSTKRCVSFKVVLPLKSDSKIETVTVDGIGRLSYPLTLQATQKSLMCFSVEQQLLIKKLEHPTNKNYDDSISVLALEDKESLGIQLEQWAVEYSSKFVHAASSQFYPTTTAIILGTAYVKKRLPESELVASMLRVASISFILRAGVKCTTSTTSHFRTIQATIDTILYQRLQIAEKELFNSLQRLIFKSLGYLNRDQIYPVALVFWQLLRMLCLGASHLSNIEQRFKRSACPQSSYQYQAFKLVLSIHLALFRSSNPLLLDFNDTFNQDLVDNDAELIGLANRMRNVVIAFRDKGNHGEMKGSIAYRKEYFNLFRKAYEGL